MTVCFNQSDMENLGEKMFCRAEYSLAGHLFYLTAYQQKFNGKGERSSLACVRRTIYD
jgi:hypothetical protein